MWDKERFWALERGIQPLSTIIGLSFSSEPPWNVSLLIDPSGLRTDLGVYGEKYVERQEFTQRIMGRSRVDNNIYYEQMSDKKAR